MLLVHGLSYKSPGYCQEHHSWFFHLREDRLEVNTSQRAINPHKIKTMVSAWVISAILLIVIIANLSVDAAYRKPPFNGSIFGKRSSTASDYEVINRALSNMCEVASETCNAWLMHQDSN
ncbi:SIFamide-related peptide [Diachasmimorpha longicaudata]|uniref:SIFamide-related peptide n=1 Tax=Diachasmimorpha longicaudata TaxID=58733 RepID=UPI0030B8A19D